MRPDIFIYPEKAGYMLKQTLIRFTSGGPLGNMAGKNAETEMIELFSKTLDFAAELNFGNCGINEA